MLKALAVLAVLAVAVVGVGAYFMVHQSLPLPATGTTTSATPTETTQTTQQTTSQATSTSSSSPATSTEPATVTTQEPQPTTTSSAPPQTTSTSTTTQVTSTTQATSSSTSSTSATPSETETEETQTTQSTTSTTTSQEVSVSSVYTFQSFLANYSKLKLDYRHVNATGYEITASLTITQTLGGNVGGVDTIKVDITVRSSEGGNGTLSIWVDKNNYDNVVKLEMNGQTIEGQAAALYGQQVISQINAMIAPFTYAGNMELYIVQGSITATKHGWQVTSVTPTTTTISGKTYKAYTITLKNIADTQSKAMQATVKIMEAQPNTWMLYYLGANLKDSSSITLQITELTPKT